VDRDVLLRLAEDLPRAWEAAGTDARAKQRLVRLLIEEVVIDLDDAAHEAVATIHWIGGWHTEIRGARRRDCREFRAGLGMIGAKEPTHAATQRPSYP
jgi:hypothetical protein